MERITKNEAREYAEMVARKFDVDVDDVLGQLEIGAEHELEHTDDIDVARKTAFEHLMEYPDYYERLADMEKAAHKKWKIDESSARFTTILEKLKKVDGKWAIVSKTTGKPLRYYKGDKERPSKGWVERMEREIQMFKNMNGK